MQPRPDGFDYKQPDEKSLRCPICNKDGLNRTGWMAMSFVGASTQVWAIKCSAGCKYGLKRK